MIKSTIGQEKDFEKNFKEKNSSLNEKSKFSEVENCLPSFLVNSLDKSIENIEEENESTNNSNELSNSKSSEEQKNLNDNNNLIIEDNKNCNNLNYNYNLSCQNLFPVNNNFNFLQFNTFNSFNQGIPNLFIMNNPGINFYNNQNLFYTKMQNLQNENLNNNNNNKKKSKKQNNKKNQNLDFINFPIENIFQLSNNDFCSYIITQKGSRDVQNYLNKLNSNEIDIIINKIQFNFPNILIDKYGNYFSQKLIQFSSPNQRIEILKYITKNKFVEISNNSFGTHPIQILIETISTIEEKKIIIDYIKNNEILLSLDSKGTYVLQKLISITKDEERLIINENIINNINKLINDPFGVCVLIKLIKYTNNKKIKEKLAKYISDNNSLNFIQHPFANYAVQSLFNQNDIIYCKDIIKVIVDNFYILSMKKFSSNVVENCIKFGNENVAKSIYKEIINQEKLSMMLNNTYGNFAIEKLISRLNKEEKNKLIKEIEKYGKEKCLSNTIMNLLFK